MAGRNTHPQCGGSARARSGFAVPYGIVLSREGGLGMDDRRLTIERELEPTSLPRLLTFKEAEKVLSISRSSLVRAIERGELAMIQAPGTSGQHGKRVLSASIDDYIRNQMPSSALRKSSA